MLEPAFTEPSLRSSCLGCVSRPSRTSREACASRQIRPCEHPELALFLLHPTAICRAYDRKAPLSLSHSDKHPAPTSNIALKTVGRLFRALHRKSGSLGMCLSFLLWWPTAVCPALFQDSESEEEEGEAGCSFKDWDRENTPPH